MFPAFELTVNDERDCAAEIFLQAEVERFDGFWDEIEDELQPDEEIA